MTRKCASIAVTIGAAAVLGLGCGSSDEESESRGPWADLYPVLDLARDTPVGAVNRYAGRLEAGQTPLALAQHVRAVREAIGLRRFALALDRMAPGSVAGRRGPRLVRHAGDQAFVRLRVDPGQEPRSYGFRLVRREGRWLIAYDELTRDALAAVARAQGGNGSRARARRIVRLYRAAAGGAQP